MDSEKKLTLGFSPCPNDTFIFDAMIHHKIDTEGLSFESFITDVEDLNQRAFRKELDITKISFHSYIYLVSDYILLNSGSALGKNCGPLLISKNKYSTSDLANLKIAIPGKNTTANLLMMIAFPGITNKEEMLFSEIENAVLDGRADAGLVIHESRFTYEKKGLLKIIDLGEYWETLTHAPIPLGGIIAKRNLGDESLRKIDRILKRRVQFAFDHPQSGYNFVKENAQEMDDEVIRKHIDLYVTKYTIDIGNDGKNAVRKLFEKVKEIGLIQEIKKNIFVENEG